MPECANKFDIGRRSTFQTCLLALFIIGCCIGLTFYGSYGEDPQDASPAPTPSPHPAGCQPSRLDEGCCTPSAKCPLGHGGCTSNDDCMEGHCAASQYQIPNGGRFLKVCLSGAAHNTTSGNSTESTYMGTQSAEEEVFDKQDYFWTVVFTWSATLLGLAAFGLLCYLYRDRIEAYLKESWDKIKETIFDVPDLKEDVAVGLAKLAKRGDNRLLALYEEYVPDGKTVCEDSGLSYGYMDLRQDLARGKIAWTGKRRIDAMYYMQHNHSLLLIFKVNRCDPRSRIDVTATLILATFGAVFVKDQTMKNIHHLPDSMESPWWPGIMVAIYIQVLVSGGGALATCSRYQKDNVEAEKRKTAECVGTAILVSTSLLMSAYIAWKCATDTGLRSQISSTLIGIFSTWLLEYVWLYVTFHGVIPNPFAPSWEKDMEAQKTAYDCEVRQELEEAKGALERHRKKRGSLHNMSEMVLTGDEEHKAEDDRLQAEVDRLEEDKVCELNLFEYKDNIRLNKDIMSVTSDIALLYKYQSDETEGQAKNLFYYFLPEDIEAQTDSKAEEVAPLSEGKDAEAGSGSMVDQTVSAPVIHYTEAGTGGTIVPAEAQGLQEIEV